jgi:hypothetical protein
LALVWSQITWYFQRPRPGRIGDAVTRVKKWPYHAPLFQLLRLLYYVGIPFAALVWGQDAVVSRLMGLQPLVLPGQEGLEAGATAANWQNWARDVGWAVGLGVAAWVLLSLGRWVSFRATRPHPPEEDRAPSGWVSLRESAYHEVHWAFYRNAPLLTLQDYAWGSYWGVWAGLGIAALEALFNPAWRRDVGDPHRAFHALTPAAMAVVSSVLYLRTENLWLAIAMHGGVTWGLTLLTHVLLAPTGQRELQA